MIQQFSNSVDRQNAKRSLKKHEKHQHPRPIPPPQKEYELKEYFVTIDSRDRDRTLWPNANQFQVKMEPDASYKGATLNRAFKNIRSVEVLSVQFPNTKDVLDQMYIYLCFPEIDGIYEATHLTGSKALAKLVPTMALGNYIYIDFKDKPPRRLFPSQGVRLDRLTPAFRSYDGTLFDFGNDHPYPNAFNPKLQTSITLRIIVQVPNIM